MPLKITILIKETLPVSYALILLASCALEQCLNFRQFINNPVLNVHEGTDKLLNFLDEAGKEAVAKLVDKSNANLELIT